MPVVVVALHRGLFDGAAHDQPVMQARSAV